MPPDETFQFLAENSADLLCRVGLDHIMRYASPSSFRLLGWTPEEMTGQGPEAFVHPDDLPSLQAEMDRAFSAQDERSSATARMRRKGGSYCWMEMNASIIFDPVTGLRKEVVVTMRDITDRKELEDRLARLAMTDGLTGLANRRAFDDALDREWIRTLREGSQMSLLLLDLDGFKLFNDRYGHQVGDDCLRAVASVLLQTIRRSDLAARYGGEELAVVLPGTGPEDALHLGQTLLRSIAGLALPHEANPAGVPWVTASLGAATALARCGGTMRMPESLLQAADTALYRAKHRGRNRVATTMLVAPSSFVTSAA